MVSLPPEGTARPSKVSKADRDLCIAGVETASHIQTQGKGFKSTLFHIAFSAVHVPFEGKPHFGKEPPSTITA
jgi:hypothetical protein